MAAAELSVLGASLGLTLPPSCSRRTCPPSRSGLLLRHLAHPACLGPAWAGPSHAAQLPPVSPASTLLRRLPGPCQPFWHLDQSNFTKLDVVKSKLFHMAILLK